LIEPRIARVLPNLAQCLYDISGQAQVEKVMRKFILATVAAISLTAGGALYGDRAHAAPLFDGLQGGAPARNIENVQLFLFGGHGYCWYLDGWNGPGWYWCGYASRRGFGWGGPEGWRGHGAPRGGHGPVMGGGRGGMGGPGGKGGGGKGGGKGGGGKGGGGKGGGGKGGKGH
jgi:hypothetical protein